MEAIDAMTETKLNKLVAEIEKIHVTLGPEKAKGASKNQMLIERLNAELVEHTTELATYTYKKIPRDTDFPTDNNDQYKFIGDQIKKDGADASKTNSQTFFKNNTEIIISKYCSKKMRKEEKQFLNIDALTLSKISQVNFIKDSKTSNKAEKIKTQMKEVIQSLKNNLSLCQSGRPCYILFFVPQAANTKIETAAATNMTKRMEIFVKYILDTIKTNLTSTQKLNEPTANTIIKELTTECEELKTNYMLTKVTTISDVTFWALMKDPSIEAPSPPVSLYTKFVEEESEVEPAPTTNELEDAIESLKKQFGDLDRKVIAFDRRLNSVEAKSKSPRQSASFNNVSSSRPLSSYNIPQAPQLGSLSRQRSLSPQQFSYRSPPSFMDNNSPSDSDEF